MIKKLPINTLLLVVFLLVLGLVVFLIIFISQKESSSQDINSNSQKAVVNENKKEFSIGAKQLTNSENQAVFYYFDVRLTDKFTFDENGFALGSFYFVNDPQKTLLNLRMADNNNTYYMGQFDSDFASGSQWKFQSQDNLMFYLYPDRRVQLRAMYSMQVPGNSDYIKTLESIIQKIDQSQIDEVTIPEDFVVRITGIGFSKTEK